MTKICQFCGKKFKAKRINSKYCSQQCLYRRSCAVRYPQGKMAKIMREAQRANQKSLSIAEIVALAQEEGMSYGKYVNKYAL
jgi:ribosomal protein L20